MHFVKHVSLQVCHSILICTNIHCIFNFFVNRFNWRKRVDYIGKHEHKIDYPKRQIDTPNINHVNNTTTKPVILSKFEKSLNNDLLLEMQCYLPFIDMLKLMVVNKHFYQLFNDTKHYRKLKQYESLVLLPHYPTIFKESIFDWSRFASLCKLSYFMQDDDIVPPKVFSKIPMNNIYYYEGNVFILENLTKLKVCVFKEFTGGSDSLHYGWDLFNIIDKKLELFVIHNITSGVYPFYIPSKTTFFDESVISFDSMINAVLEADSDLIIYQKCTIKWSMLFNAPRKHELPFDPKKSRVVVFNKMYQFLQLWAVLISQAVVYVCNFEHIIYLGDWEEVCQKGVHLPNQLWNTLITKGDKKWKEDKKTNFIMLFAVSSMKTHNKKEKIKHQNHMESISQFVFDDLVKNYDDLMKHIKHWKTFKIGIGHNGNVNSAFVMDLTQIVSKTQLQQCRKKWIKVIQSKSVVESSQFAQEWENVTTISEISQF